MIPKEILAQIKHIEIKTKKLVNEIFSGEYESIFKGRGVEFSEVRQYQPGDDTRIIDWNVSARFGHLFVKKYAEERELNVILLVDLSASGAFGSFQKTKNDIATEISAILAFSAIKNNDKVGLMLFTDRIEKFVPPKGGKRHILRLIREILYFKPKHTGTRLEAALKYLNEVLKRKAVVFLLSDFFDTGYEKSLKITSKKHDLIAISINDPREAEFPDVGYVEIKDAETGGVYLINTHDKDFRKKFKEKNTERLERRKYLFKTMNLDHVEINTDKPYTKPLLSFFKARAKKI